MGELFPCCVWLIEKPWIVLIIHNVNSVILYFSLHPPLSHSFPPFLPLSLSLPVSPCLSLSSGSLRKVIKESDYFGYPCVLSHDTQLLEGFLTRKDIITSLGNTRFIIQYWMHWKPTHQLICMCFIFITSFSIIFSLIVLYAQ